MPKDAPAYEQAPMVDNYNMASFVPGGPGHSSRAVHRAYARGAQLKDIPPLEGFVPHVRPSPVEANKAA